MLYSVGKFEAEYLRGLQLVYSIAIPPDNIIPDSNSVVIS